MTDHDNERLIRKELAMVAASKVFGNSPTLISFLRLVVERTLDGKTHEVKGPTIAAEVYGRDIVGNPAEDSTVRVEAVRLRKKLAEYYATEGQSDPVRIAIPKGAYVPTFEVLQPAQPIPQADASTPSREPRKRSTNRIWYLVCAGLVLSVSLAVVATVIVHQRPSNQPVDYRVDGSILKALDAQGGIVWQYTLPRAVEPQAYARTEPSGMTLPEHDRLGLLADLGGGGRRNLLFAYQTRDEPTTLFCFASDGRPAWSIRLGGDVRTTTGQAILGHYQVNGIAVLKHPRADGGRIVVSSRHTFSWPSQIAVLTPKGVKVAEYWHPGWIFGMTLGDIAATGTEQIILAGLNEGYRAIGYGSTIVALDPEKVFGQAPVPPLDGHQLSGVPAGEEAAILLFRQLAVDPNPGSFCRADMPVFVNGHLEAKVLMGADLPYIHCQFTPSLTLAAVTPAAPFERQFRLQFKTGVADEDRKHSAVMKVLKNRFAE